MKRLLVASASPAAAIFVFGVVYGALARPHLGVGGTLLASALIFSGSVQFTVLALLTSGAASVAMLAGAAALNLRNIVLGAVLRPRLGGTTTRRAGLGWFLTDEAAGLALVSKQDAARVLMFSGAVFYLSWVVGTALGIAGASIDGLQEPASAVFPVLFIGLAAMSCTSRANALRAVVAAVGAALMAWAFPGTEGVAAVVAAILASIPGGDA